MWSDSVRLWLRLQHSVNEMNASNYLLHYAGRHTNIEKGVDYYYCYSTNKFHSLAAHYKEYRSQSELATFRKRLEIIHPRSSHCMFVSNWISNCSQSSQRWLNSTIHTHLMCVVSKINLPRAIFCFSFADNSFLFTINIILREVDSLWLRCVYVCVLGHLCNNP